MIPQNLCKCRLFYVLFVVICQHLLVFLGSLELAMMAIPLEPLFKFLLIITQLLLLLLGCAVAMFEFFYW